MHRGARPEAASAGVWARRCTRGFLGESSGRCWPKLRDGVSDYLLPQTYVISDRR